MSKATAPNPERVAIIRKMVDTSRPTLAKVLPKSISVDRVCSIAMAEVHRRPELLDCNPKSLLRAVYQACELGLEIGIQGEAYLVPFKGEVQLIPGYRGLVRLVRRSGEIDTVEARAVFVGDEFDVLYGFEPRLTHRPNWDLEQTPESLSHTYAIATFKTGARQADVMGRAEVERIRTRSRAGANGPWGTDFVEMAKKTVVRRLCKSLPMSREYERAVAHEAALENGEQSPIGIDVEFFQDDGAPQEAKEKTNGSRTEDLKTIIKTEVA